MKRYIFLLFIIPLLISCGAGGGGGVVSSPAGGDNNTSNKPNPACSSQSSLAKIRIKGDGIYRVTYLDLYNACVDLLRVAPAALKMTNQGNEIAIDVIDYNQNGYFDDGDYIEFYGKALSRGDSRFRFTETNVYWFSAEAGARKRIAGIQSNPKASQGASSFLKILHMEEDIWYEQKNYPEVTSAEDVREHWFWGESFTGAAFIPTDVRSKYKDFYIRDYDFSTPYIDKSKPVSFNLRLQSITGSHYIKIYINGNPVGEQSWESAGPFNFEVPNIPGTIFNNNGTNKLTLESTGTSTVTADFFYLDWFEIGYYHTYYAEYDMLEFTGDGLIGVSNFSTATDLSIYEISDPANVTKIIPAKTEWVSSGYKVVFSNPGATEGRFLALSGANKKTPAVEAYTLADLRTKDATYIIITHGDFYDAIKSLADYRSGQGGGYKVLVVKVNDIYDEFGYGIETPQAIKDFLRYAHENWPSGPQYVLLVGDATIDYKDISGYGSSYGVKSYVPAYLYNYPGLGEVPSDNWFVDVSGDVLPEMNIGRIPAKSPADVTAVVNKIISHETSSLKSNDVVLVADYNMVSGTLFEALSDSIAGLIPSPDYSLTKLYQSDYPNSADLRKDILSAINGGPLIVNYTGHGSVVNWTTEDAFSSEDVAYLTNKSYPFVVALNCLNGYFVLPDDGVEQGGVQRPPSIGEAFLLAPEKGALGVLAASSIGYPSEHDPLAQALYSIVFSQVTLGEAVTKAKEVAYKNGEIMEDVVETFIFFGDPATRLK